MDHLASTQGFFFRLLLAILAEKKERFKEWKKERKENKCLIFDGRRLLLETNKKSFKSLKFIVWNAFDVYGQVRNGMAQRMMNLMASKNFGQIIEQFEEIILFWNNKCDFYQLSAVT